jgi:acetolactate synthase-1/2/3 large subunit
MIVADYIAKFLVAKGVKHVFGFQGSAMLKMLDSIVSTGSIEYIQGFHEQASAFAADAYARVSGMPGVAMATAGPGASNLVTGIANAYYDSVPVVFLTGQDYLPHIRDVGAARQNGFQDMDIVPMVKGITKYAVRVDDCDALPGIIAHAWEIATSGRKGPVLIDIPIDVQFAKMSDDVLQLIEYNEKHNFTTMGQESVEYIALLPGESLDKPELAIEVQAFT